MEKQSIKTAETKSSFLFKLTWRFTIFLTGALLMAVLLYVAGNFQHFLDGTQQLLLLITSVVSLALIIFSAAGIIQCLVFGIAWKSREHWLKIILFVVSEVVSVAVFILSRVIIMLSEGINL